MNKPNDKEPMPGAGAGPDGEAERDNDAKRPDGSGGTSHDSTAQKTARDKGRQNAR